MEQKLTTQEIAKVYAMYPNLQVECKINLYSQNWKKIEVEASNKIRSIGVFEFCNLLTRTHSEITYFMLSSLTSLVNITDEHAIDVAKILGFKKYKFERRSRRISIISEVYGEYLHLNLIADEHGFYEQLNTIEHVSVSVPMQWEVHQHLINLGYAVPLFFGPGHWANGKNAIELKIAEETK